MIGKILATVATAAVATAVPAGTAQAAEPSTGSIDPTSTAIAWSGPAFTAGVALEDCAAAEASCDHFLLTVGVDAAYWDTHDGELDVGIGWRSQVDDFDLYVLDEGGQILASSTAPGGQLEQLSIDEPAGTYEVLVVPISVTDADYVGWASLSTLETPPPVETGGGSGGQGEEAGGAAGSGSGSGTGAGPGSGGGGGGQGAGGGNADGPVPPGPAGLAAPPALGLRFTGPPYGSRSFDSTAPGATTGGGAEPSPTEAVPATTGPPVSAAPVPSLPPERASSVVGRSVGRVPDSAWLTLALGVVAFALTVFVVSEPAASPAARGPSSRPAGPGPVASIGSAARGFPVDRRFVLWWA